MNALARRETWGELGPAMRALPDQWCAFVEFYVLETFRNSRKGNFGAQTYAARAAGFGKPKTTPLNMARIASRLMRDERIIAAIAEEARNMRRGAAPEVVKAWLNMVRDPEHPGHARAVAMGLDRDEPLVSHQQIDVTHKHVDPVQEEIEELRAHRQLGTPREKLIELFGGNGLARLEALEAADAAQRAQAAKVIDGEAIEVTSSGNDEDI
jgi:hypothetical protein